MKIKTGDISIVENAGTFLLWYDNPTLHSLTPPGFGSTIAFTSC